MRLQWIKVDGTFEVDRREERASFGPFLFIVRRIFPGRTYSEVELQIKIHVQKTKRTLVPIMFFSHPFARKNVAKATAERILQEFCVSMEKAECGESRNGAGK